MADINNFLHTLATCLPGFLIGVVFHEYAHAFVATKFGDDTPERYGRLTLNPSSHADLMGTVIFPLGLMLFGMTPFGWAKPVPVNPANFKRYKAGSFWVAFAGPGANIIISIVCSIIFAIFYTKVPASVGFKAPVEQMLRYSVMINLVLAVFNLIPFPPLDGSKMVMSLLDYNQARKYEELQRFTFLFFIILWMSNIFSYLLRPVFILSDLITRFFIMLFS
jgi:Zn-dependent protease